MYLKNITCPDCGTKGMVLIDGDFYNCDECNYYWEIPKKQKEVIKKITNEMDEKLTSDNNDCTVTRPADVSPKSPDGDFVQS